MSSIMIFIFNIFLCHLVLVKLEKSKMEKYSKSFLNKNSIRNKNKRTEKFYNGEEIEVDENGQIPMDPDLIEEAKAGDSSDKK